MKTSESSTDTENAASSARADPTLARAFHGVRYQTKDVGRSVVFYL
jgi:hypothetical protein